MLPDCVQIVAIDSCRITDDDYFVARFALSDGSIAAVNWPLDAIHAYAGRISESAYAPPDIVLQ